jgi:TolB-like protein
MKRITSSYIVIFFILALLPTVFAGGRWYNHYKDGLKFMQSGNWSRAIAKFNESILVKNKDMKKIKTYGMHFMPYFPHREKGICFYNLGRIEDARRELKLSLRHQYSSRAQEFLSKLGNAPITRKPPPVVEDKEDKIVIEKPNDPIVIPPIEVKLVGERMGLAVLPFQTSGLGGEMGNINVVEQLMTTFYNLKRFKLFERSQLESILEEQKLGMSGIVDASTAAQIGKGIGVDAMVLGSVTRSGRNLAIDARLIDTETAAIITAQDEMSNRTSIQELKEMIDRLANKIYNDLPLVDGYVIGVNGDQLTLDLGSSKKVKKGMKCIIYSEGQDIIHPLTKKVLGKQTEELGEVKLTEVYPEYSIGKITVTKSGMFEIGCKVITK